MDKLNFNDTEPLIRFVDLIAIAEHLPKLPNFPTECPNCKKGDFSSDSLILLHYDGDVADFAVVCQHCKFSHMRVSVTSKSIPPEFRNPENPEDVPPGSMPDIENMLLTKEIVTVADLFGKKAKSEE